MTTDTSAFPITERKRKLDGRVQEFACELAHREPGLTVVRFPIPDGAGFNTPIALKAGTTSFGYFWKSRPYNLYRFVDSDGGAYLHRFDAIAGLRLRDDVVEYRDLLLDWWAMPDDTLLEEDRDEFQAAVASGSLSAGDVAQAEAATHAVYSRYRHIIDEAAALQARFA